MVSASRSRERINCALAVGKSCLAIAALTAAKFGPTIFIVSTKFSGVKIGYFVCAARVAAPTMIPSAATRIATNKPERWGRSAMAQPGLDIGQAIDLAGAVPERLGTHAQLLQQREVQIRERGTLRIANVAGAPDPRGFATNHRDRQIVVEVRVAIADPRPVEEQRVIEHRGVAFTHRRQFFHKIRKLLNVVLVDLVQAFELGGLILMMRERMM